MAWRSPGGSTGQPLQLALPGGGSARICVKRDVYADGRIFVGKGISPDIAVRPTLAALRANCDETLEQAIAARSQAPAKRQGALQSASTP